MIKSFKPSTTSGHARRATQKRGEKSPNGLGVNQRLRDGCGHGVIHDLRVTTCKIRLMKNDDDREGTIVSEATVTRNAKESDCKWKARREALRQALELAEMTFGNPVGIGPGAVKTPHYNRTERAEIWKQYFAKVSH